MKRLALFAAVLALGACATESAPAAETFPIVRADGRMILQSVPSNAIPDGKADYPKAEAYCAKEGKVARISGIATNVQSASGPQNQVYFQCFLASEADKPKTAN